MKKIFNIISLIAALLLSSCTSSKYSVKDFSADYPLTNMNGRYWGGEGYRSFKSAISKQTYDKLYIVESVELDFDGKEHLTVRLYDTENDLIATEIFKGKIKKNYFQFYHTNKLIPIPGVFFLEKDRIRIGLEHNDKLLVHSYYDSFGWFFIMVGGHNEDYSITPELLDEYAWSEKGYKSIREGSKLGMADSLGNTVLQPQYDLILPPDDNGRIRVKKGTKWALCDTLGNMKTEFVYSKISGIYESTFYNVSRKDTNGKWQYGRIDQDGKVLFDCIYDQIVENYHSSILCLRKDSLYAFAMPDGRFLTPFVFRQGTFNGYWAKEGELRGIYGTLEVDYKGKKYFLKTDGKMYLRIKKNIFTPATFDHQIWIDGSTLTLD
ncbi:WG repeat-containing protein [Dysgonomonas massiliensis]|uniref:WG repeat-containing protein n=1 Tax=Dysgonomonas massiliensis TaxID=2040292 RepID=UPI000C767BA8|nr:WG repeat-containing protein [Dysgonomonas massiliensis]